QSPVDKKVKNVSDNLQYRDFLTVGLLVDKLKIEEQGDLIKDNWIYIQEPDVQVGRLQIFNNWSPFMVTDSNKVWIGLEYFCYTTDDLWKMKDKDLIELGKQELEKIGIIEQKFVQDATVIRMEKTYPAYFGVYKDFDIVKKFTDTIDNLFLLGRNGQHKYNNQDHSMLTAMAAVDNIINNRKDKANIWSVNMEQEYHEEKTS
ncbi:MAG: protoporphyrinogen oxidase, partial [Alteromonas naphthalenivorans]